MIHTHTRAGVAVSAMKCGLLPISQHAMRVQREVTYHDYEGIALDMDERARMATDLGKTSKAMILRNHGLLTLGESVREAFELMYYLDCACQIQVDAVRRRHGQRDPDEQAGGRRGREAVRAPQPPLARTRTGRRCCACSSARAATTRASRIRGGATRDRSRVPTSTPIARPVPGRHGPRPRRAFPPARRSSPKSSVNAA